jgi:hypothetical protein
MFRVAELFPAPGVCQVNRTKPLGAVCSELSRAASGNG